VARSRNRVRVDAFARDFVMARLAAARAAAQEMVEAVDDTLQLFIDPSEDEDGKDRKEAIEAALESAGCATRALECALDRYDAVDPMGIEPWDDGDEDEEDDHAE
jgi:hypothetical protein